MDQEKAKTADVSRDGRQPLSGHRRWLEAIQGAPKAERSVFPHKYPQTFHLQKQKKILGSFLGKLSISPL